MNGSWINRFQDADASTRVAQVIRLSDYIAKEGGWLPLEGFMQLALYHPEDGYYSASVQNIGARGDFSTTATLSPILSKALVHAWKEASARYKKPLPIIEIGAGNAALASAFLSELGFWGRMKVKYNIVENSAPLRRLQHLALGKQAMIHTSVRQALKACEGKAFIFSNELVDAFPARIFEFTEQGWQEVGLCVKEGKLQEELRIVEPLPSSTALECAAPVGQRVEVHQSYATWFLDWLPHWVAGTMITIDYGDMLEPLYHRQPKGTLRAYQNHQRYTGMDVYDLAGKRDLTCDINFSDLLRLTEKCVGDRIRFITQREFLHPHATETLVDQYLTDGDGPGKRFKVLIHTRDSA